MLGERLEDPDGVESSRAESPGLGLLPIATRFHQNKALYQVEAVSTETGLSLRGYEIHMGESRPLHDNRPVVHIRTRNGQAVDLLDGAQDGSGRVWGCYIHGLFDNDAFRRKFLADVRAAFALPVPQDSGREQDNPYERLADAFEQHLEMVLLEKILDGGV